MLLSKKKSLVLSEYYYERSTALSLCVCVSVCVSFRRGGASVDDFDTMTEEKEDDTIYHKEEDEFWRHAPGEKGRFNLFVDDDSFFSSCVFVSSSPFLSFFDGIETR